MRVADEWLSWKSHGIGACSLIFSPPLPSRSAPISATTKRVLAVDCCPLSGDQETGPMNAWSEQQQHA